MSDFFHERVPADFIFKVFETMQAAHWHKFQILTKRSDRLKRMAQSLPWPTNVWMGVSVESPKYTFRIDDLREVPAAVRFLSIEPLLEEIPVLNLNGVDWVIVGGESGPKCRPMQAEWVRRIRRECKAQRVPFFFKQWGGTRKKIAGRLLDGRTWDEMPTPKERVYASTLSQSIASIQIRQPSLVHMSSAA
jgi:protein gp37